MPLGTQSYGSYGRPAMPANTSPSGRGINPQTGVIGSMPGGMDYLAGFGPAPKGVNLVTPPQPQILGGLPGWGGAIGQYAAMRAGPQGYQNIINSWNSRGGAPVPVIGPNASLNQTGKPTPQSYTNAMSMGNPMQSLMNAAPTPSPSSISWAGSGIPYAQMNSAYKNLTQGLTPAQILNMFHP